MLRGKRIMALLSTTLLFTTSSLSLTPFCKAEQLIESKVNSSKMVLKTDKFGLLINPIQEQFEKDKIEFEKKKAEELRLQKEKELKRIEEKKKDDNRKYYDFVLTYYALLLEDCGKLDGITSSGKKISRGMIASPKVFKFGTKIIIEGNEYVVEDRGSSKYIKVNNDGSIRLDIYIPRNNNESDREYSLRVSNMGVKRVKGYIVK